MNQSTHVNAARNADPKQYLAFAIFMGCAALAFTGGFVERAEFAAMHRSTGVVDSVKEVHSLKSVGKTVAPDVETVVCYHFEHDGIVDTGNYRQKALVESVATQYPAGSKVTVYYDPRRPARSRISEPAPLYSDIFMMSIFGSAALIGLALFAVKSKQSA